MTFLRLFFSQSAILAFFTTEEKESSRRRVIDRRALLLATVTITVKEGCYPRLIKKGRALERSMTSTSLPGMPSTTVRTWNGMRRAECRSVEPHDL